MHSKQYLGFITPHVKISKVVSDVLDLDLLNQQISFVEEKDNRHRSETPVVHNGVEDVDAFHQSVGDPVL
jgi:hypothetical protein